VGTEREGQADLTSPQDPGHLPMGPEAPSTAAPPLGSPKALVPPSLRDRTLNWALLLLRVFRVDVLACPRCDTRLTVLCAISQSTVVHKILTHLQLPAELPPLAPVRAPPQLDFDDFN
jgi:hypothetical protein